MYYFLQLMPHLKVIALPYPRKAAIDSQKTIKVSAGVSGQGIILDTPFVIY